MSSSYKATNKDGNKKDEQYGRPTSYERQMIVNDGRCELFLFRDYLLREIYNEFKCKEEY
jgi:hypothetical protein